MDTRTLDIIQCDGRSFVVAPDVVGDFTKMPFEDNSFHLVVFAPPYLRHIGETYGSLPNDWQSLLRKGFSECMRALAPYGTLVFMWSERGISKMRVIDAIGYEPLFGHTTDKKGFTSWMCFMKGVSQPAAQTVMDFDRVEGLST